MSTLRWIILAVCAAFLLSAGGATAAVTVMGNGLAAECSSAAQTMANNRPSRSEAVQACTLALDGEPLSRHEFAATYVNRGVLYLSGSAVADARRDFDQALKIEPKLPEAMVDRGAALMAGGDDRGGAAEITRGLALDPVEPEKAYYNRAVAEERLGDLRSAYFDFLKASELKPDWSLPKAELMRFKVSQP